MADATSYPADPGGVFASDVHRRVAAHLHADDEGMGWTPGVLLYRLAEDHATPLPPLTPWGAPDYQAGMPAMLEVLAELESDGLVEEHDGGVWTLTEEGFEALTGPIANEPPPEAEVVGPAVIDLGPTPIGGKATTTGGVRS